MTALDPWENARKRKIIADMSFLSQFFCRMANLICILGQLTTRWRNKIYQFNSNGTFFFLQHLDIVASKCKPSTNNLTRTKPCKALQPKQSSNASILNLQFLPVFPQLLGRIKLLPEGFITPRNTVSHTQMNRLI